MDYENEFDSMPDDIENISDMSMNPKFYLHQLYQKYIDVIGNKEGDIKQDILRLRSIVETIEIIGKSVKIVPMPEYEENLKQLDIKDNDKITNAKLSILTEYIFSSGTITSPLIDGKNKM